MISFPSQQVWEHCYDSQWNGMIVKEAFMHPAKLSRGLIERIYDQMLERGWLRRSDMVADCFGGVGCGGVTAAYRGLHWFGVELEQRFVGLARRNFELHKPKLEYIGCPQPQIVQGDSRRFAEIVRQNCKALVTSPPYAETLRGNEHCGIDWEKAQQNGKDGGNHSHGASVSGDYGKSDGQIGALGSGSVDAVVGSPPYSQPHHGGGGINVNGYHPGDGRKFKSSNPGARTYQGRGGDRTDGNIETLAEGEIGVVVTSPPWESNCEGGRQAGQIGKLTKQTYWEACAEVYASCYKVIAPGGYIVLVVKDYIKKGQRVPLCDDTCKLLAHIGFSPVMQVRAMLKQKTTHNDLFVKEGVTTVRSRASFFRRLAEKKGSPPIDWEEVLIWRKPVETAERNLAGITLRKGVMPALQGVDI